MSTEIAPCPFCGESNAEVALYNRPCVVCRSCDADGPAAQRLTVATDNKSQAAAEAIEKWNRRAFTITRIP